jgi:hypothetical protein
MRRLIDADKLFDAMEETEWYNNADRDEIAERLIMDAPSIDIVRCRECKWYDGKGHCKLRYGSLGVFEDVRTDDFCSYGERSSE